MFLLASIASAFGAGDQVGPYENEAISVLVSAGCGCGWGTGGGSGGVGGVGGSGGALLRCLSADGNGLGQDGDAMAGVCLVDGGGSRGL